MKEPLNTSNNSWVLISKDKTRSFYKSWIDKIWEFRVSKAISILFKGMVVAVRLHNFQELGQLAGISLIKHTKRLMISKERIINLKCISSNTKTRFGTLSQKLMKLALHRAKLIWDENWMKKRDSFEQT